MTESDKTFYVARIETNFSISELECALWESGSEIKVSQNWDGSFADGGRHFRATSLWSDDALYVRFRANQAEPLIINDKPVLDSKTTNLWDGDVCEIFIAPDKNEPRRYFEFEAAPTGEWIDLAIDSTSGERVTDWEYHSQMEVAARIDEQRVTVAVKIPWEALGLEPQAGDVWLGNIFRCVGSGPDRGYLAWQPTFTEKPNFHVPEKFGEIKFVN